MKMRYAAVGLLAIVLLAPTGAAAPLVDQIDNGGYEDGLDHWRIVEGDVNTTGEAYEGDLAAQLNAVGETTTTTLAQEVSLDNEDAPIVPNAEYAFDFAALLNTGTDTPVSEPPEAFGQIVWKNALGETSRVDQVPVTDTDEYVEKAATFQAPEDATAADIQFHLVREKVTDRTDANLKVDEVAFGPADPTPSPSQTNCLQVYVEKTVGPVTVTYNCGFDVTVDDDRLP